MRVLRVLAGAAGLLALGLIAGPARAASIDDYLGAGYEILVQTYVPGVFTGCRRGLQLTMADGSRFTCTQGGTQASFGPRVYVLARAGDPPSVVLIGSQSYAGVVLQLGGNTYLVPRPVSQVTVPAAINRPVPPDAVAASPLVGVQSIDKLQAQDNKRLNDTQGDPVPVFKRPKPR